MSAVAGPGRKKRIGIDGFKKEDEMKDESPEALGFVADSV